MNQRDVIMIAEQLNHLLDTTGLDGLLIAQDSPLDAWLPSARANDFKRQPLDAPAGLSRWS